MWGVLGRIIVLLYRAAYATRIVHRVGLRVRVMKKAAGLEADKCPEPVSSIGSDRSGSSGSSNNDISSNWDHNWHSKDCWTCSSMSTQGGWCAAVAIRQADPHSLATSRETGESGVKGAQSYIRPEQIALHFTL